MTGNVVDVDGDEYSFGEGGFDPIAIDSELEVVLATSTDLRKRAGASRVCISVFVT